MDKVTSIEHLKKLCDRNGIHYDSQTKKFEIYNDIDETWQRGVSEKALYKKTMIPEAIEKGALFYYGVQLWGIE